MCRIQNILSSLADSEDYLLGYMAKTMKVKYDKYWESTERINKLLIISTLLDPRCKMGFVEYIFGGLYANNTAKVEEMKRTSNDMLIRLYETYKSSYESLIVSGSGTQLSEE